MSFARTPDTRVLLEMLTRMRPAGSKTERRFIREYLEPLGLIRDLAGNLYKRIGDAPILWSCHTDTVHRQGGSQLVTVEQGVAKLPKQSKSNCLGADCTAGVWIMSEMIRAGKPGMYIFHRGEEIGGVGSSHIATRTPQLVQGLKFAVAFDRRGTSSVITHQFAGRCCSDDFAFSLINELRAQGLEYRTDDGGTFTDTANYTDLIGECTNLSVGFNNEHRATEALDLRHVVALRDAMLALDVSQLVAVREPGEIDPDGWSFNWPDHEPPQASMVQRRMVDLVRDYPEVMADLLSEFGYDAESLAHELYVRGEIIRTH